MSFLALLKLLAFFFLPFDHCVLVLVFLWIPPFSFLSLSVTTPLASLMGRMAFTVSGDGPKGGIGMNFLSFPQHIRHQSHSVILLRFSSMKGCLLSGADMMKTVGWECLDN
jgi:hypothetical protein